MYEYNVAGSVYSKIPIRLNHVTCDYSYDTGLYSAYFWSYSSYCKFGITYVKASAWSESKYK